MSSKRVKKTPQIESYIRASVDDPSLDTGNLVVFEARALSTEAIQKKSGFYQNARISVTTLKEMEAQINQPGKAKPLQIMHNNELLPVGRVFRGSILPLPNGEMELRTMFYIPADKASLIADIESSLIDEVSVGLLTTHAFCSECEFDYFGPDASFTNFMDLTCSNGHTIGKDGVHARLTGMKDWAELSLVNRGAAKDAKIMSRAKQAMGEENVQKLAASAVPIDARLLTTNYKLEASASGNDKQGDDSMDKEMLALVQTHATEVANLKVELTQSKTNSDSLTAKITEFTAALAAKDTEIETLKKTQGTDKEALVARATTAETKLTELADKLLPHAKASLVASGVAEADLPKDAVALVAIVEKQGLKLHQVFGSAVAGTKKDDVKDEFSSHRAEAFKINKRN